MTTDSTTPTQAVLPAGINSFTSIAAGGSQTLAIAN